MTHRILMSNTTDGTARYGKNAVDERRAKAALLLLPAIYPHVRAVAVAVREIEETRECK